MIKFHHAVLALVFSGLLATPEAIGGVSVDPAKFPHPFGDKEGGILSRVINSQKPTQFPTERPTEPTATPTESPAPSPSPSENPTKDPLRDTEAPTESPTESPAPSPSPSEIPSAAPTVSPSDAPSIAPTLSSAPSESPSDAPTASPSAAPTATPSAAPTISAAPSSGPTTSPSDAPSNSPTISPSMNPTASAAPSGSPSSSPSDAPSDSPSAAPTQSPSVAPSDAPSMSPTAVTDRTKTAVATLLLEEITDKMDRMALAEFELFTLDFLRKKIPKDESYILNTLAVTVLSQKTVTNPDLPLVPEADKPPSRKLESEDWTVGLEVEIRSVSVVTDGRVPKNFNFTEVVLYSFYNHWDQYLWQLGNNVDFFNPLVEISNWQPIQIEDSVGGKKKKGKASFVIAVLFSFVAFGLAVFASYIAIRRHMQKQKNGGTPYKKKKVSRGLLFSPKNSPMNNSGADVLNYLTQTMSDEKDSPNHNYHDGDIEGGGAMALMRNVNIDMNEDGMESVILSPRANFQSPSASIRNGLFVVDEGSDDDKSPLNSPEASSPVAEPTIGGQIKKWLTPRGLQGGYASSALSNRRLSSDPPENQSILGYNYGKDPNEPVAVKASTKNYAGVYTTDKSTIDGRSRATGISYNKKPANDDGQFTLPISFFSNRGPGTNVSGVDSPMSSLADSNASSFFAIGNMNKSFAGQSQRNAAEEENYEVSALRVKKMNEPSSNNYEPDVSELQDEPAETNENTPAAFVRSMSSSDSSAKASSVKLAAKHFEKQQQPLREIQPPSSTVGVETILGARSRDSAEDDDKKSDVSSSFLKSRSIFSPGNKKPAPSYKAKRQELPSSRYGRVNVEVQEQETRSVTSHSTLGARPMTKREADGDDKSTVSAFSTLSSIMRRPGCYDVYAPSGPIGIVVDTSKDGPSVHSLKSTSPMLGLISPGDLIVALDGEDTRKMTAAALTRLMARKSRQKERKITLLS